MLAELVREATIVISAFLVRRAASHAPGLRALYGRSAELPRSPQPPQSPLSSAREVDKFRQSDETDSVTKGTRDEHNLSARPAGAKRSEWEPLDPRKTFATTPHVFSNSHIDHFGCS